MAGMQRDLRQLKGLNNMCSAKLAIYYDTLDNVDEDSLLPDDKNYINGYGLGKEYTHNNEAISLKMTKDKRER